MGGLDRRAKGRSRRLHVRRSFRHPLRKLSTDYLHEAWERLSSALREYGLRPTDLSWGYINTFGSDHPDSPIVGTGWVSRDLADYVDARLGSRARDERYKYVGDRLSLESPALRLSDSYRSIRWDFPLEDFSTALRLVEHICLSEVTDWSPPYILKEHAHTGGHRLVEEDVRHPIFHEPIEPWVKVAQAINDDKQDELDAALKDARRAYPPLGYSIMLRGYKSFVEQPWERDDTYRVRLPDP